MASNSVPFLSDAARHPLFNFHEFQFKTMSFVFTVHSPSQAFSFRSAHPRGIVWPLRLLELKALKNRKSLYERIHHHIHTTQFYFDLSSCYLSLSRPHSQDFCLVAGFVYTAKLTIFYLLDNTYECQCIGRQREHRAEHPKKKNEASNLHSRNNKCS